MDFPSGSTRNQSTTLNTKAAKNFKPYQDCSGNGKVVKTTAGRREEDSGASARSSFSSKNFSISHYYQHPPPPRITKNMSQMNKAVTGSTENT